MWKTFMEKAINILLHIKDGLNKLTCTSYSWIRGLIIVKVSILEKEEGRELPYQLSSLL